MRSDDGRATVCGQWVPNASEIATSAAYQATLKEIAAALKLAGVYSLAGTRAAVLSKYGVNVQDSGTESATPTALAAHDRGRMS
jgi:hypothetical protein